MLGGLVQSYLFWIGLWSHFIGYGHITGHGMRTGSKCRSCVATGNENPLEIGAETSISAKRSRGGWKSLIFYFVSSTDDNPGCPLSGLVANTPPPPKKNPIDAASSYTILGINGSCHKKVLGEFGNLPYCCRWTSASLLDKILFGEAMTQCHEYCTPRFGAACVHPDKSLMGLEWECHLKTSRE